MMCSLDLQPILAFKPRQAFAEVERHIDCHIMNKGRPREFDDDEVMERVMNCFRCYGYDGTTFDQLVEDSGLSRSSLRNAFGDKDQLYEMALKRYTECKLAPTFQMLRDEKMGGDLLRSLLKKM